MKTEQNKTNHKPQDVFHVTVSDVRTGKILKDFKTAGLSVVYSNKNGEGCFSYVDGLNTIRAIGMALGLKDLSEEIEKFLKENTDEDFVEGIKKVFEEEIKKSNPVKREGSVKEAPEMTFSGNMESKEGE